MAELQDSETRSLRVTNLKWTSALEIGHPGIDEQHKRLFLLAEAVAQPLVNSADQKPAAARLHALIDFTQKHFAFEEGLMRSAGYPRAGRHAKYHASLLSELKTYCARVDWGIDFNPASLIDFLRNWLVVHIDTADRDMVDWLKSHKSNGDVRRESS
jgi:hemerythrin